ncbi:MAG: response regulator [Steroidobacteraceae bacterium]|nr:response regulator [Steroidobacteraceae bacterium]
MSERVLFVDDDPNVLDGIRRQLRNRFSIETANGAAAGLEMFKSNGPFAVVVSDMRMPEMNGARFLAKVNEISPNTVRMVLSGQSDMESTIAAVNEGHIFRFLMKPCEPAKLLEVINAGIDQYRLVNAERHLLENTLNATVKVLVEVLGLINPDAQRRATQIEKYAQTASDALKLPGGWKYHLAAMLSQVGCISLPAVTLAKVYGGQPLSDEEKKLYESHPEVAGKLLGQIPRLEDVAGMVAGQLKAPSKELVGGNAETWKPQVIGAAILWTAVRFDQLVHQGRSAQAAAQQIRQLVPHLPQSITDAMITAPVSAGGHRESRSVTVNNLMVGMILEGEVLSTKGIRLVPKGAEITGSLLGRLRTIASGVGVAEPIPVSVLVRD